LITVDPKKRATLAEVKEHAWVMQGFDEPPQSYLPQRPLLNDSSKLSKDIISRLEIFGYNKPDIYEAFSPNQDFTKPNAIRATYFLLSEMVAREQIRLRVLRNAKKSKIATSANTLVSSEEVHSNTCSASTSQTDIESRSSLSEPYRDLQRRIPQPRAVSYNDPNKQILPIQNLVIDDKKRRQSVPLMIPNTHTKPPSTTEKLKEELRAVSGWFLNFSSTTSKSASEILDQIRMILGDNFIAFSSESRYILQSEVDVNANDWSVPTNSNKKHLVAFQIEICQIPRMNLHGIHFKRIAGGVWNYKKVCNRILTKLQL
jgi:serine/threonine protein kinase